MIFVGLVMFTTLFLGFAYAIFYNLGGDDE